MKISSLIHVPSGMLVQTYEEINGDDKYGSERLLGWAVVSDENGDRVEPFFLDDNQQPIVYTQHLDRVKAKAGDKLQEHSYQVVNDKGNLILG